MPFRTARFDFSGKRALVIGGSRGIGRQELTSSKPISEAKMRSGTCSRRLTRGDTLIS